MQSPTGYTPYVIGTATLVAGSATISLPAVTATDIVKWNRTTAGAGVEGNISYAITAGTGIVFTSSANTDVSTVFYEVCSLVPPIVKQSPKAVPNFF